MLVRAIERLRRPPFPMHGHRDMTLATLLVLMMVEATPLLCAATSENVALSIRLLLVHDVSAVASHSAAVQKCGPSVVAISIVFTTPGDQK